MPIVRIYKSIELGPIGSLTLDDSDLSIMNHIIDNETLIVEKAAVGRNNVPVAVKLTALSASNDSIQRSNRENYASLKKTNRLLRSVLMSVREDVRYAANADHTAGLFDTLSKIEEALKQ